ncbi:MAG: DUF4364 family protein [Candidatus Bathyarchaeia archaeon]
MKNKWGSKKRRDRLEIIAEILESAKEGCAKTRIMYKTNLNFLQFEQHISSLLEAKLIEVADNGRGKIYKITEKGNLLLQRLKETSWIFNEMKGEGKIKTPIIQKQLNTYLIKR